MRTALPSADEILSKYTQALGSEQAIPKVTSRMTTATEGLPTGPGGRTTAQAMLEQYAKASNLQTGSGVKFPFVIRMLPGTSAAVPARQSTITLRTSRSMSQLTMERSPSHTPRFRYRNSRDASTGRHGYALSSAKIAARQLQLPRPSATGIRLGVLRTNVNFVGRWKLDVFGSP